jgi:integrase
LPATHKNLADVHGALEKINARIHLLQDLDVKEMSKQELRDYILKQLGQPEQPRATLQTGIALDTLLLDYMEHARIKLQQSEGTLSLYLTAYNVILRLTTKDLSKAEEIMNELAGLEYGSYYRTLQKISVCCNWAVEKEKIHKNPFLSTLKSLKEPNHSDTYPDPFSRQAMARIMEAYCLHPRYSRYADLVEFYFLTGARTGEAVALRWGDIDFKRAIIHIRKTIALVRGKHDPRNQTKTRRNREFPIEDPALKELLQRRWSPDKKPNDFVFQEPGGSHINRVRFYYSWYGQKRYTPQGTDQEAKFTQGIVSKLAALGEEEDGIDHYRPQYNTRHTFITLAIEGLVELNESTMRDITTLAKYVGNSADIILEHYLGGSDSRTMVVISHNHKGSEGPKTVSGKKAEDRVASSQQIVELERHNSRLQATLRSLVQFVHAALLQFVPEALRTQLSEFATKLVGNDLPNPLSHSSESFEALDEEIAQCAALLTLDFNSDS